MRKDIEFPATDGTILRRWHYLPDGRPGKHPTIVMAHGFSAVKEMYLDKYAESFAQAGFASVAYDNRNFGASDGLPRQEIDPWLQIRDYSDAITFAQCLSETDAERIGVWGSSYSGGHVLVVAAIDRRVKCVVSQVPVISGSQGLRRLVRADFISRLNAQLAEDRRNRAAGKPQGRGGRCALKRLFVDQIRVAQIRVARDDPPAANLGFLSGFSRGWPVASGWAPKLFVMAVDVAVVAAASVNQPR